MKFAVFPLRDGPCAQVEYPGDVGEDLRAQRGRWRIETSNCSCPEGEADPSLRLPPHDLVRGGPQAAPLRMTLPGRSFH